MTAQPRTRSDTCPACGNSIQVVDGAWLREERLKAGISLRAMARSIERSTRYLADLEENHRRVTQDAYAAILAVLAGKKPLIPWSPRDAQGP